MDADVIIVGAGLAGLTAAHELTSRGRNVALVEQENAAAHRTYEALGLTPGGYHVYEEIWPDRFGGRTP